MTKVPFLLLLITFSGYSSLAKNDSLSHIKFKTDFERHVFEHLDSVEPLDLLLAISENMSFDKSALIKNKIVAFIESNDKIAQGKETKMVKKIFAKTHSSFFSKYEEVSNFENIFELKEYNCVSATALYSLIFDAYGIPYQVKEAPSHVYTVAYPGTHDILVESTAPTSGYYYATEGDIHNSIQNLISLKYVTQDEVDSMGERAVYDAFFFKVEDINLRELAGLQYHNEAISYADKEDYEAALNAALKCQMIYPSERIDILILGILDMTLTNRRIDTWSEVKNLMVYGTQDNVQPLTFFSYITSVLETPYLLLTMWLGLIVSKITFCIGLMILLRVK